jgi:formate hydrogenlyase transcriptional activator
METESNSAAEALALSQNAFSEVEDAMAENVTFDSCELHSREFPRLIGKSAALRGVLGMVRVVAPTDATVLIKGETGTGKELIAEAIHKRSDRSKGPFVKVNCAAIPVGLLESELFGHERGAYTGAVTRGIGRFERANRGTLFLDEIGDLPLEMQPKLLRVMQERQFERLGGSATINIDVRVICATHRNLSEMVNQRQFRADLFYRLSVFPIELPPLRDRREDIPLLIRHFAFDYACRMRKQIMSISEDFIAVLTRHSWPGNVRELQNFIERSVILSNGVELSGSLSEFSLVRDATPNPATEDRGRRIWPLRETPYETTYSGNYAPHALTGKTYTLAEAERAHISAVVEMTNGLISGKGGAAEALGVPPSTLRNRMKKLGIKSQRASCLVPAFVP